MTGDGAMRPSIILTVLTTGMLLSPPAPAQTPVDTAGAVQAADSAARAWLAIVDQGRYLESWDQGALALQLAVTRQRWEEALKQARGPQGPFAGRERISARYATEIPNAPPGRYVLLQYRTEAAGGHVAETVVPMWERERGWRVSGYFIRPDQ
jgi:hypothetical protein